ncbi:MAG: hypothetical protein J0L58_18445, partial [Burkholderiales bacterium]|nr:hypothetical protein [Burkholderiales bacterium]
PVNDANSDFAAGHGLLSLRLGGRAGGRSGSRSGMWEWLLRLDNLLDRRVTGSVIVGESNQRFFEPNAGRSALLSLRLNR